jgi:nitroreductase
MAPRACEGWVVVATVDIPEVETGAAAVLAAIRERRSIGKVAPERPPRAAIEQLLEAATRAPNHHLTQPWRFFVLAGEARRALGEAMARATVGEPAGHPLGEGARAAYERMAAKPLRAPVVIAVAVEPAADPKVREIEEVAAGAAAIQNMLLAAHALGLGAMWRTGEVCDEPAVKAFFGLGPRAHLLGFVYVGYPAQDPPRRERTPAAGLTRWLGWDDDAPSPSL